VFNLALAVAFLLVLAGQRMIGKPAAHVQRAAQAGFVMALLTGPLLYASLGRWAPGLILVLAIALVGFIQSMRNVRCRREASYRLPSLPAPTSPARV
ncbi:MAG: hypothetical protein ACRDIE_23255, partial [Chloroflexota bacterium]